MSSSPTSHRAQTRGNPNVCRLRGLQMARLCSVVSQTTLYVSGLLAHNPSYLLCKARALGAWGGEWRVGGLRCASYRL